MEKNFIKLGFGILQITSTQRCPQVWPCLAGLFSQQILLNLIKRCSNQHAEIFMNETNMRCCTDDGRALLGSSIWDSRSGVVQEMSETRWFFAKETTTLPTNSKISDFSERRPNR